MSEVTVEPVVQVQHTVNHRWTVTLDTTDPMLSAAAFTASSVGTDGKYASITATQGPEFTFTGHLRNVSGPTGIPARLNEINVDDLVYALDEYRTAYELLDNETTYQLLKPYAEKREKETGESWDDTARRCSMYSTMFYMSQNVNAEMNALVGYEWHSELASVLKGKSAKYKALRRLATIWLSVLA